MDCDGFGCAAHLQSNEKIFRKRTAKVGPSVRHAASQSRYACGRTVAVPAAAGQGGGSWNRPVQGRGTAKMRHDSADICGNGANFASRTNDASMFRPYLLRLMRPLLPDMTWEMADRSSVYLTFDDGPTPGVTEWVLDTLAGYGVRATFFCLGKNAEQHPELYRAIVDAGHRVGNHSYSH